MTKVSVATAVQLVNLFWPEFVEIDGSVFVPWDAPEKALDSEVDFDHTETEAFHNHTHMIDIVNHKTERVPTGEDDESFYDAQHPDFLLLCRLGKTIAKMWFEKLKADFPNYEFRVYYTERDNPIVRFHRVRDGEPNWLEEADFPTDIERGTVIVYDTRYKSRK